MPLEDGIPPSMSDQDIEALVGKIQEDEAASAQQVESGVSLAEISGFSEAELQQFLVEHAGVAAATGVQQSVIGFAVTIGVHC